MTTATALRHLSPAEAAKALGVTVRALRVYEAKGLVRPVRTQAGWRVYGPDAVQRLHQLLTLKRLGLSLARIGVLLDGPLSKLDSVLALQEEVLGRRADETTHGLALVRSARLRIAAGESLSLEDLTQLTRETALTDPTPDWAVKMQPFIDRHLTEGDKAAMASARVAMARADLSGQWEEIISEAKALLGTDPAALAAQNLVRRWRAQVAKATGGDPDLTARMGQVWRESMADGDVAPSLPFGPDVMAFLSEAARRGDAQS